MRFSTLSLLALPLLAAAADQQNPLDQVQEQARYWFDKIQSFIPNPSVQHESAAEAAAGKAGGKAVSILTLNNWRQILKPSASATEKSPEEWWVLITGGNKTCFGQCHNIELAYNESALAFATTPTAPHMAYLNCDQQPVLCNSWTVGPPMVYVMDMAPGKPVDIHIQRLNTTTTTAKSFTDLHRTKRYLENPAYEGQYFHPFNGLAAQFGVQDIIGYFLWIFGLIPSWAFMIGVSFFSRTMMSRPRGGGGPVRPVVGGTAPAAAT